MSINNFIRTLKSLNHIYKNLQSFLSILIQLCKTKNVYVYIFLDHIVKSKIKRGDMCANLNV